MGSGDNYADERPPHRVCVEGFFAGRTEVTVRQYARCVKAGRCQAPKAFRPGHPTRRRCNWGRPGHLRHPVNCVTWAQARRYCRWRGQRLPTEAEWERAARGRRPGPYPWGRARPGCRLAVIAALPSAAQGPGAAAPGSRRTGPRSRRGSAGSRRTGPRGRRGSAGSHRGSAGSRRASHRNRRAASRTTGSPRRSGGRARSSRASRPRREPACRITGTLAVGSRPRDRSRWGLLDVAGNVSEWTADWYAVGYYKRSPMRSPRGPHRGRVRAVRGCSFRCLPGSRLLRRTARQWAGSWDPAIGLRCVGKP